MSAGVDGEQAARILSLDNGGSGTYSQLLIIEEYMQRLDPDTDGLYPADYFELMGGVGFSGIVAIMLGRLRMRVEEAMEALVSIAREIFPIEGGGHPSPGLRTKSLKKAIEAMLEKREIPLDLKMKDGRPPATTCKVALYAATETNLNHQTVFRTYAIRGSNNRLNPTVVDAICATMAVPDFFSPVKIGPKFREQSFVGGGLGANNPTRELLKEASAIFGVDRRVAHVLSLGCGRPQAPSLDYLASGEVVLKVLKNLASDCEMVAKELSMRLSHVPAYLRLNVDKGMEDLRMDDWEDLGAVGTHTAVYLGIPAIMESIESSVNTLKQKTGTVTLGQINQARGIQVTAKTVPASSPFYVARKREVAIMRSNLVDTTNPRRKIFAITGMGGCGKTQMVSHFLEEMKSERAAHTAP